MGTNAAFIGELKNNPIINPNDDAFGSIWHQYERVIVESLITSFGLDFLLNDQEGGDVDTIYNVRNQKDASGKIIYKNTRNQEAYDARPEWDKKLSDSIYQDERYKEINSCAAIAKDNGRLVDAYTGKKVKANEKIDLDHVIAKKEIYDDPGRVLAGVSIEDLANSKDNLKITNRSINRSMKDKNLSEYADILDANREKRQARISELKSKDKLLDKERNELKKLEKLEEADPELMKKENAQARKAYEDRLNRAYYKNKNFKKDTAKAATVSGVKMGTRQVLGLIFTEIWFCSKEELQSIPSGAELKEMIESIGKGIKRGLEQAKEKYKDLIAKFGEGLTAGALSSLTTTLCNIFFTTAKNLIRCIRQVYASVIQAGKVLLFNPDDLLMGDRIKTATVIIATGSSVLAGTAVSGLIEATPIGKLPEVGNIVQVFCGSLVSGLLSCTLLIFLDRSKYINGIINCLNAISSEAGNVKEIADTMEQLAAKIADLDIDKFKMDTEQYAYISNKIAIVDNEDELNELMLSAYKKFDIRIPWDGDFDSFMGDSSNRLVFE